MTNECDSQIMLRYTCMHIYKRKWKDSVSHNGNELFPTANIKYKSKTAGQNTFKSMNIFTLVKHHYYVSH